ncbi:hypothetical protein ACFSUS_06450 [Spirosoma soli]|uniref:Uncharacterized protein n=1 Tax=Spirosoma soli TaxID=1770529 RepID=A0ABW5M2B0_9BACT
MQKRVTTTIRSPRTSPTASLRSPAAADRPAGIPDKLMTYDEYLTDERVKQQREELYVAVA